MSDEGFPGHVWGPGIWKFIHLAALGVRVNPTPTAVQGYVNFFKGLGHVMPCALCRRKYRKMISSGPLQLTEDLFKDRRKAFEWTVKLHDRVSRTLPGKVVKTGKDWGDEYEKLRYQPEYKDWTSGKNDEDNIRSFIMTRKPVVLYLAPLAWHRLKYNKGLLTKKWEMFKKKFGDKVRFGVLPKAKFQRVLGISLNKVNPGEYIIFKRGRPVSWAKNGDEALYTVRTLL